MLVPSRAPYLAGADLLIAADCVPFSHANFHREFLRGRRLLICCPKLDNMQFYIEKLTEIFKINNPKTITIAHMEVPCCYGLVKIVSESLSKSGRKIPVESIVIGINGDKK